MRHFIIYHPLAVFIRIVVLILSLGATDVYSQKAQQDRIKDSLKTLIENTEEDKRYPLLVEYASFMIYEDSQKYAPVIRDGAAIAYRKNDDATVMRAYEIFVHYYNYIGLLNLSSEFSRKRAAYALAHDNPRIAGLSYALLARFYLNNASFDSSQVYIDKAKDIFSSLDSNIGLAIAYDTYGLLSMVQGKYKEANNHYFKALEHVSKTDSANYLGIVNYHIGLTYTHTSDYELAAQYIHRALEVWQPLGDIGLAPFWNATELLGNIYLKLKKYDRSLDYHRQALAIRRRGWEGILADSINLSYAYSFNNIAETYYYLRKYDSAYYYADMSLKIKLRPTTYASKQDIANSYLNTSKIVLELDSLQLSETYAHQAVKYYTEANWKDGLIESYMTQAAIFRKKKQFGQAIQHYELAKDIAEETGARSLQMKIWRELAGLFEFEDDINASNHALKKYVSLKDSIFSLDMDRRIAEMMVKYEADKKEIENTYLRKQNENQQRTQTYLYWAMGLFVAFLITLAASVVLLRKNLYRKTDQLSKQQEINSLMKLQFEKDLEFRNKELQMLVESIKAKNDMLETIKTVMLDEIKNNCKAPVETFHRTVKTIQSHMTTDQDWDILERQIHELSADFREKLIQKHPGLTPLDFKMLTYVKLKIPTREIAGLLNITEESVRKQKYRLRKKLNLEESDLGDYLNEL